MSKISELSDGGAIQSGDTLIAVRSGGNVKVTYGGTTTANIDGGTIDGTVIGGSSAAAITGTTITGTSFVSSGDMTFGDNDKAVFGAGSDLEIYHDGSNSFINETGTGSLYIGAESEVQLRSYSTNEKFLVGTSNGATSLYYNGVRKLDTTSTGIDVTGTVTADGLSVDGAANVISGAASGSGLTVSRSGHPTLSVISGGTDSIFFSVADTGTSTYENAMRIYQNGDISFYEDTGTTAKFFWDASAESLAIGTTLPYAGQTLTVGATAPKIQLDNGAGTLLADFSHDGTTGNTARLYNQRPGSLLFGTNNTERMRIDSSGKVGIGTSSPDTTLDLLNSTNGHGVYIKQGNAGFGYHTRLTFLGSNGSGGFNTVASLKAYQETNGTNGYLRFDTNGDTERARIDSSGNLLVGGTSAGASDAVTIHNSGYVQAKKTSATTAYFDRLTTDGTIAEFRKDGTTVGSIGTNSSNAYISGTTRGLHFTGTAGIIPCNEAGAARDADTDIGSSSTRFKDLYLSGGVYLGGTGAANLLDDYEEGTWTPTISSGTHTYSVQDGWYCKVGNVVHCYAQIAITSRGSSTGELGIGGLPFSETGDNTQSCPFGINNKYGTSQLLNTSNETPTCVSVETSTAYIRNWKNTQNSYTVDSLNSSGSISISFTYLTNA